MSDSNVLQVMSLDALDQNTGQQATSGQEIAINNVAPGLLPPGHGVLPPGGSVVLMQERRMMTVHHPHVEEPMSKAMSKYVWSFKPNDRHCTIGSKDSQKSMRWLAPIEPKLNWQLEE